MGNSQDSNEPVAWLTPGQDLHLNNGEGFRFSDWTPLYTTPPQRKPLTDEQKQAIHNETGAGHSLICLVESYINGIKE